jgi:hypothetical protein
MKSLRWLFAGLFLLIFAAAAYAQVGGGVAAGSGGGVIGSYVFDGRQGLKGVPFSADIVNETTQTLGDGTRIHRETLGKTFRDSEGRTRNERENQFPDGPKRVMVTIFDPSQQVMIMLDPQTKTATVNHFKRMFDGPPPVKNGVVARTPLAPPVTSHPSMKREDLGTKEIEGFTVTGTRITRTMEAGSIGNDRPLTSVHETWSSPDLKTVLLTTSDDPRSGQHTMRLTNIRTGEPDPLLFQVPADYTVKEN